MSYSQSHLVRSTLVDFVLHLKLLSIVRVVPLAMERAIKEILSGIFQRYIRTACQTTKELVLKVGYIKLL